MHLPSSVIQVPRLHSHDAIHLEVVKVGNTSITIKWSEETVNEAEKPHQFKVLAVPEESHSNTYLIGRREWVFDYTANQAELISLHPGTLYNITVWTVHDDVAKNPVSGTFWTKIGVPDKPLSPEIIKKSSETMEITLQAAVVVVNDPFMVAFHPERLTNYSDANEKGIPYYIAAELSTVAAKNEFVIGDGKMYGGYLNAPLKVDGDYAVVVGIVSSFNGITKSSYSEMAIYNVPGLLNSSDDSLQTALSVSIGVVAALLIIAILIYFAVRRFYKPRLRRLSEMPLAVSNPAFEGMMLVSKYHMVVDKISDAVWDIPVKSIEVYKPIVGYGKFGHVQNGIVHKKPQQIPVIIVTTQVLQFFFFLLNLIMTIWCRRNVLFSLFIFNKMFEKKYFYQTIVRNTIYNPRASRTLRGLHCGRLNIKLVCVILFHQHHHFLFIIILVPSMMTSEEKNKLLYGVEIMNAMSHHQNVVALIGKYELDGSLQIVIEHSREILLSALHNSRCTDFSPSYSTVQTVSSFTADQLMQFILNISKGLQYLHGNKVIHQHLMSKSILLIGETPKITNFSMAHYEQDNKSSNNTRMCAAETLQHKRYTYKSDIWSLAVLYWEIVTLAYGGRRCTSVLATSFFQVDRSYAECVNKDPFFLVQSRMFSSQFFLGLPLPLFPGVLPCMIKFARGRMSLWRVTCGTPFHSFSNKEVTRKVCQGTRLPQPSCISYDLFQLMLDCWQTDPDERPSVESVIQTIEIMVRDSKISGLCKMNNKKAFRSETNTFLVSVAIK
ncbi:putative tyrosine-protein kinase Wsck [Nymphon striatum]|nr:putative tyrosine-protein kinase Wsck [Nymphon striatum]